MDKQKELEKMQQKECIERLKILEKKYKVYKNIRKDFEEDGTLYYSEDQGSIFKGILYWLHNNPEWLKNVQDLENLYNMKVYHCILTHFEFGDVLSLLYVSDDPNEWETEKEELINGMPIIYGLNVTDMFMSEFGSIQIEQANGGICRVD